VALRDAPVGVFDSGVGGLTVARAILDQLPHEQLLYLADTAHLPYGPLPIAQVRRHALAGLDALAEEGVKLLVIACNAATAACLHDARERYQVPVVEVIRPAVRRAVATTRNGRVGVIGTQATIGSGAYRDAFAAAPQVQVISAACPQFVDFVERGETTGEPLLGLARSYLEPLHRAGVDTLVLGCTHYPLLAGLIGLVMGERVALVSSADETARDVYRVLAEAALTRAAAEPPQHRFLTTGEAEPFASLARRFLGTELVAGLPGPVATGAGLVAAGSGLNAAGSGLNAAGPGLNAAGSGLNAAGSGRVVAGPTYGGSVSTGAA
jgi:glutamate racemase